MTNINLTEAIRSGILTFEQAMQLQGMAGEVSTTSPETPKAETPKAKKPARTAKKQGKSAKKQEETKAETPKAEEYSYTKGGAIIQYAGKNTLKANHLRRVNNAISRLVEAGFCVSWKRIGGWVYINHDRKADKKTSADFKAATLPNGWVNIKGAWVDTTMLADYADNFRK